jgi:hypothetical protein
MPKWKDRECSNCGAIEHTASKSRLCKVCFLEEQKQKCIVEEKRYLNDYDYSVISGPEYDKHNHRVYKVLTPCGHEWEAPFTNLLKQVKNAQSKGLRPACGICGPKHRMKVALDGFMDKYAVDYDLDKMHDYRKKVRGLTEKTYKKNKHLINPRNLPRGRNSGYHIDHKVPIIKAFKEGWTPEQCAAVSNLQMLEWTENLSKGAG